MGGSVSSPSLHLHRDDGCSLSMDQYNHYTMVHDTIAQVTVITIHGIIDIILDYVALQQPQHLIAINYFIEATFDGIGYMSSSLPSRVDPATGMTVDRTGWRYIYGQCPVRQPLYIIMLQSTQMIYIMGYGPSSRAAKQHHRQHRQQLMDNNHNGNTTRRQLLMISCPVSSLMLSASSATIPSSRAHVASLLPWRIHDGDIPASLTYHYGTAVVWRHHYIYITTPTHSYVYDTRTDRYHTIPHPAPWPAALDSELIYRPTVYHSLASGNGSTTDDDQLIMFGAADGGEMDDIQVWCDHTRTGAVTSYSTNERHMLARYHSTASVISVVESSNNGSTAVPNPLENDNNHNMWQPMVNREWHDYWMKILNESYGNLLIPYRRYHHTPIAKQNNNKSKNTSMTMMSSKRGGHPLSVGYPVHHNDTVSQGLMLLTTKQRLPPGMGGIGQEIRVWTDTGATYDDKLKPAPSASFPLLCEVCQNKRLKEFMSVERSWPQHVPKWLAKDQQPVMMMNDTWIMIPHHPLTNDEVIGDTTKTTESSPKQRTRRRRRSSLIDDPTQHASFRAIGLAPVATLLHPRASARQLHDCWRWYDAPPNNSVLLIVTSQDSTTSWTSSILVGD